jgi:hypothetical protein
MRRSLAALATGLLLVLALAAPAAAAGMCDSGRAFGQMHAAEARAGMLGREAHPGMHRGFAGCME